MMVSWVYSRELERMAEILERTDIHAHPGVEMMLQRRHCVFTLP